MSDGTALVWHPYDGGPITDGPSKPAVEASLQWTTVRIYRGDLERLDKIITFANAMAQLFSPDFADDLWNLRNGMVPFEPGDRHFTSFGEVSDV